ENSTMPPRIITLDLEQLLREKRITVEEYQWLLGLARKEVAVQAHAPNVPGHSVLTIPDEELVREKKLPLLLVKEQSPAALPALELLLLVGGLLVVGGALALLQPLALLQSVVLLMLFGMILTSWGSYLCLALGEKWEQLGSIAV